MLPPRHQQQAQRTFLTYWPRRILSERAGLVLALVVCVISMIVSQAAPEWTQKIRSTVFDRGAWLLSAASVPAQRLSNMTAHLTGLSDLSNDMEALRAENAKLKQWYDRARQLEAENLSLRGLVRLADVPRARYVTARVIAEGGSAFAQGLVVDTGKMQGVATNMVAMTGLGVVGRVVGVSERTAQILLLNDVNARIPVVIENSRHRGVLAGDNDGQPQLRYLPEDASVTIGERVLTSGHGGIYAPGLPVGVIDSTKEGQITVKPFADLRRLDFVQLIDFGQQDPLASPDTTPVTKQADE